MVRFDMMVRRMDEITETKTIQPSAKLIDYLNRNDFEWNFQARSGVSIG